MSKANDYLDHIESHILPFIDYGELQRSYETDMVYAKGVLNRLHTTMGLIYGGEILNEKNGLEGEVVVPGVICGIESGKMCIALLTLDLSSSGEHIATDYLCRYGVISQDGNSYIANNDMVLASEVSEIKASFLPYYYGYTAEIPGDIHIEPYALPQQIKDVLADFHNHHAELLFETQWQGEEMRVVPEADYLKQDSRIAMEPQNAEHLPDPTGTGYLFAVTDDGDSYMPNVLHIQRDDSLHIYPNDDAAARAAEADGVKLIYGMPDVPDGIYLDTPENRAAIADYFEWEQSALTADESLTGLGTFNDGERVLKSGGNALVAGSDASNVAKSLARTVSGNERTSVLVQIRKRSAQQQGQCKLSKETSARNTKSQPEH